MAKINIPFKGMGNIPDDGAARDGELLVGINVRHEGGEIVQRNNPARKSLGNVGEIYYHGSSGHLLAITEDGKGLKDITANKVLDLGETRAATYAELNERLGTVPTPGLWDTSEVVTEKGFEFRFYVGTFTAPYLLTISGSGEVPNIDAWRGWDVRYIEIKNGATSIGEGAFADCTSLQKIAIPDSVTKIGKNAFKGCNNLESVVLPDSVKEIKEGAFGDTKVYFTGSQPPIVEEGAMKECVIPYGTNYASLSNVVKVEDVGVRKDFASNLHNISFVGNIVKIGSGDVFYYAMWKNEEYVYLGELPSCMEVGYTVEHHIDTIKTKDKYYKKSDQDRSYDNVWPHVAGGFFDQLLYTLYNKQRYIDSAMFVVAARLFDGSYIQLSPIGMVEDKRTKVGAGNLGMDDNDTYTTIGGKKYNFVVDNFSDSKEYGVVALCSMNIDVNLPLYDWRKWEDIITSVDVFSSGSIMYHAKKEYVIEEENALTVNDTEVTNMKRVSKNVAYKRRPIKEIEGDVANALFYRIASYDLKGEMIGAVADTSPSNLAVQPRLENVVPYYGLSGDVRKSYNSREHLANTTKRYKAGGISVPNDTCLYSDVWDVLGTGGLYHYYKKENIGRVMVVTSIQTEKKLLKVKREIEDAKVLRSYHINLANEILYSPIGVISPLISYPDSRAVKMEFYVEGKGEKGKDGYVPKTYKAFDLKPGGIGAYCVNESIEEIDAGFTASVEGTYKVILKEGEFAEFLANKGIEYSTEKTLFKIAYNTEGNEEWSVECGGVKYEFEKLGDLGISLYQWEETGLKEVTETYKETIEVYYTPAGQKLAYGELKPHILIDFTADGMEYEIPEVDDTERDDNILYVSETDNPLYYPYTYRFGAPIVAMESSAEEVSAGQFGQYPMNVFTGEGIWALGVDTTGKGAYATQTPLSREVCSGKPCAIVGGVAFPTMNGVKILQGSQVVDITATMKGERDVVPAIANTIAEKMNLQMPGSRFGIFLNSAKIAYDYTTNEVVIYNDYQSIMYRYGVSTGMWTMENSYFDNVIPAYPQLMTVKSETRGKVLYTYDNIPESERANNGLGGGLSALPVDMMLFTRPMRLGMFGRKRVSQVALRGTWSGTVSLYVLGSNDGKEYKVIAGKENVGGELHRDVVTRFCRSGSYEYIAVCVTGKNFEGRLTGLEMIAEPGIGQNRLR